MLACVTVDLWLSDVCLCKSGSVWICEFVFVCVYFSLKSVTVGFCVCDYVNSAYLFIWIFRDLSHVSWYIQWNLVSLYWNQQSHTSSKYERKFWWSVRLSVLNCMRVHNVTLSESSQPCFTKYVMLTNRLHLDSWCDFVCSVKVVIY